MGGATTSVVVRSGDDVQHLFERVEARFPGLQLDHVEQLVPIRGHLVSEPVEDCGPLGERLAHSDRAARARSTAAATSADSQAGTVPNRSPVTGVLTDSVALSTTVVTPAEGRSRVRSDNTEPAEDGAMRTVREANYFGVSCLRG